MPRNLVINTQVDRNNPRVSDWQPSPTVSTALQSERNSSGHLFKQQNNSMLIEEVEEEEEDSDDIIEEDDDEEDDLDEADDSEYTSSPSIPDENINFDMVYALHTFVATVEGQATVYKGDALTLLDDSNSYWWLVSVIKTSEVGYIPAENIETPFERLARLNKHRNTDLTSLDQATHYINKEEKKKTIKKRRVTMSKDLSVQAQIILIGDDEEEEVGEAYEEWQEDMQDDCSEASDSEESDNETDPPQDIIEPCSPVKQSPTSSPVSQQQQQQQPEKSIQPQPSHSLQQPSSQQQQPSPIVQPKPSLSYNGTPSSPRIDDKRSSTFWNIFARGKKEPTKPITPNASNEDTDGRSISSVSSSILMDDKTPRAANGQAQLKVLRVFAGNINVGAMYHSMLVDDNTSAEQLLIQAMERFHIAQIENKTAGRTSRAITPTNGSGVEYYLTVKSMNGDEIIMAPQDKPLAIFQTLTTHLTTPMPSLTHVKQLSQQETPRPVSQQQQQQQQQSRPAVGFYLHKRIRRINEREGQVYIKVSHYTNTTNIKDNNRSSTFSKNLRKKKKDTAHERIDKLIAVSASATIAELTTIALDKFHMNHHNEHDRYRMTVSTQPDKLLNPSNRLIEILHDDTPREAGEKVFILRKTSTQPTSRSAASLPPRSSTSKVSPEKISRLKRPPLSIPQLDTKTKDIVRRVDTVLKTCSKDKKLGISNTSSGIAVSRNLDAGVDVILIHGTLRTRPLPKNQIEYALMTNNSVVVARKVIHQPSKQLFSTNLKNVTEQDLDILVRYATAHLDVHDQKSGRKPVSSLNGSLSLDLLDSSSDQVSSLGDLEKEFQRIIASHTF